MASLDRQIVRLVRLVRDTFAGGGKLMFCGNGGSAADASHLAAEYIGSGMAALSLAADTAVLTALANDFGYEQVFARQVQALGSRGDLLVMHSTSGDSANLIVATETAERIGIKTVGVLARDGGALAQIVDLAVIVPTTDAQAAQEEHIRIGHQVWQAVR